MSIRKIVGTFALVFVAGSLFAAEPAGQGAGRGGRGGQGFMGGFGMGGTSKLMLLNREEVQKELNITAEQKEKITKLQTEARGARPEGARNPRDMSQDERKKAMEDMQKKAAETRKANETKLAEILNKDQVKRLDEINIQQMGIQALRAEEVQKALKLTQEQNDKIKAAFDAQMQEMRGMGQRGAGQDRAAMQEKRAKLQKDTEEKVLAILTAEQKDAFTKMKGKELKLEPRTPGQGGQGRRGNRGGEKAGEKGSI